MEKFLRERGIGEEVIKKLQEEKIDKETVNHMRDDELANYLPRHGDRLALVRFCKKKSADGEKRKNSLMKKLQQKLNEKKRMDFSAASDSDEEAIPGRRVTRMSKQLRGNVNAKKNSRRIDIGWIHKEGEEVRQIRTKKGGGTRKLIVDKDTTNHELLDKAKELFFPKGRCAFGLAIDYDFELWDFAQNRINGTITVAEMYDNLKLGTIRVYLKSSVKSSKDESESIIEEAARIAGIRDNCTEKTEEKHDDLPDLEPQIIVCEDSSGDVIQSSDLAKPSNPDNFAVDESEANDFSLEHYIGELTNTESTYTHDDSEVTFPHLNLNNDPLFETDGQGQTQKLKVEVNEGRILLDMLTAFKDPSILNANIEIRRKIHGGESEEMESGSGSGMMRDVLTEFWSEFYQQCTVGCGYKVPFTRHDYQKEEWLAVSRIIYKGWKSVKYLPIEIAPTVLEECLYGAQKTDIFEVFMKYLSNSEAAVLMQACTNFDSVDQDDLLDVIGTHSGRSIPTKDNLKAMCNEIAMKELVQDTKFVIDVWRPILAPIGQDLRPQELQLLYQNMIPSAKTVMSMLRFPHVTCKGQDDTICYMRKFLKELDDHTLRQFLRFCTGSDLLLTSVKEIQIEFIHLEGLSRRPIAHTCGCVLKLSDNYANFPEFRSEFNSVLKSGIWLMDII